MPREALLDNAVRLTQAGLLTAKVLLGDAHHDGNGDKRKRHCGKGDAGKHNGERDHLDGDADDLSSGGYERRDALVERLAKRIHVVGHAREHVSDAAALKVAKRHAVDFGDDLTA